MRKISILIVAVAVLAGACSSNDSSSSSSSSSSGKGSTTTQETASVPTPVPLSGKTNNEGTQDLTEKPSAEVIVDDFFFSPTFMQVTQGQALTIHLSNEGGTAHTFTATGLNINETLQPGDTKDVAVTIKGTDLAFHCNFHQSAGMQGSFYVSP